MSKPLKSQWDFGELFSPKELRRVMSVSELTASVKRLLEREIGHVWVTGEVTNLRVQSSGHSYFSLKDTDAQLSCVLFRGEAREINRELLHDGQKVVLGGDLTVYEARGQYQIRVTAVELQGVGALQIAFEKLKQKLSAEGLFAPERKRTIPRYTHRIGVVTSPSGAALRDVLNVIQRRNPGLEIIFAPCRVQGQGAGDEIAAAIRLLNEWAHSASVGASTDASLRSKETSLDLILVTRGGGSLEDLWAFNEEVVARAIFDSVIPVVSAVGHEIDFTISDFVADLRAATPSVAAELITEDVFASREFVATAPMQMIHLIRDRVMTERDVIQALWERMEREHPRRRLQDRAQRLDDLQTALGRSLHFQFREREMAWKSIWQRFTQVKPLIRIARDRERLGQIKLRISTRTQAWMNSWRSRWQTAEARLGLLSPNNVLQRGYSITRDDATGKIIREANEVRAGQSLVTRLKSGEIRSVVKKPEV